MDSANKSEERLCSSPESGFGSEHQYSPTEEKEKFDEPTTSTGHTSIIETGFKESEDLTIPDLANDNDVFSCLKIVNVQSLAVGVPQDGLQETLLDAKHTCEKDQIKAMDGAARLQIKKQNNKKILTLNANLHSIKVEWLSDLNFSSDCFSKETSPICIPFSGLPVVSKRKTYALDEASKYEFVIGLLSREDRKRYHIINSRIETSQAFNLNASAKTLASSSGVQVDCTEAKPTTRELKLAMENYASKHIPKPHLPFLASDSLHSSCSTSKRECPIDSKYEAFKCASHKEPSIKKEYTGPEVVSNVVTACSANVNNATAKLAIHNSSVDKVTIKQEINNSKSDRIKRLKELLQQKEKNLQQVRKNCGFIS